MDINNSSEDIEQILLNNLKDEEIKYSDWLAVINEFLKYGESIKKSFDSRFKEGETYTKEEILKWVERNINNAKFNSVACKWIKAYIVQEINNNLFRLIYSNKFLF